MNVITTSLAETLIHSWDCLSYPYILQNGGSYSLKNTQELAAKRDSNSRF